MSAACGCLSLGMSLQYPTTPAAGQLLSSPALLSLTWFHSAHDSSAALQHRLVDGLLVFCELAIGREGAGDVRSEAVVLSTHVEQTAGTGRREAGGRRSQMPTPTPPLHSFCWGLADQEMGLV